MRITKIRIKNRITKIMILLLVVLDQAIKLKVKSYYGIKAPIVENILYFNPSLNKNYSWINSLFQIGWGRLFHIIITIFILFLSYYSFKYLQSKNVQGKTINIIKIFLFSGAICSLIDRVFWGGSLDYIFLKGFFIFDLKDFYLTIFELLAIILVIKNWKIISKIKNRDLIEDYITFIKDDISINRTYKK